MKKLNKLGVVLLASGLLLTACAKSGNSSNSSSTSSKLTASEQKQLKQATSDYKTFVEGEIDQLLKDTEGFSETLKSGNLEEAKKQYPLVRMAYERSEPIGNCPSKYPCSQRRRHSAADKWPLSGPVRICSYPRHPAC